MVPVHLPPAAPPAEPAKRTHHLQRTTFQTSRLLDFCSRKELITGAAQRHGSALRRRGFDGEFLTKYEASCLLNLAWNRGAIQRALARAGG